MQAADRMSQSGAAQLREGSDAEAAVPMLEATDKELSVELKGLQDRIALLKNPQKLAQLRKR